MATITYINETKGFRYENGDFVITGKKYISEGIFQRVDDGFVSKNGTQVAWFNFQVIAGEMQNLSINFINPLEAKAVMAELTGLFKALNA